TFGRGKYQMTVAPGREQAPGLATRARRKQQDRVPVRELDRDIAALRLFRRNDNKSVALVHPRPRLLVAPEQRGEPLILQAAAVVVRPVGRTLPRPGIDPEIVASRDGPVRTIEAPRALDVQRVVAYGPFARGMRPDRAE